MSAAMKRARRLVGWYARLERAGAILAASAWLWFAVVSLTGMFALYARGHLGAGLIGNALVGENAFRWKSWYPSWNFYTSVRPPESVWACSHPYGTYWMGGLMVVLFRHQDFAERLPAVVFSILTPVLLYLTVKDRWGTIAAAATAWGYACLPITMAFAQFQSLEVFCMFGCVLFFWGHVRYQATGRARYLAASLLGVVTAGSGDWPGYIVIGIVLGWGLVRAHVLPQRLSPPFGLRLYTRWWSLAAACAVLVFTVWMGLFVAGNRVDCWLAQANARKGGGHETIAAALTRRAQWIDLSFTPVAILLGKIAAPVGVARLLATRHDEEVFAGAVLVAATIQYVAFSSGADVHPFWPHYFGLYFAFGLGQLVATVVALARRALARLGKPSSVADVAGLAVTLAVLLVVLPDGIRGARYWRGTGGTYGYQVNTGGDLAYVLEHVVRPGLSDPHALVWAHYSTEWGLDATWAVAHEAEPTGGPPRADDAHPVWVARGSALSTADWLAIAQNMHVRAYGDIWVVFTKDAPAPIDGYSLHEHDPGLLERWLVSPTDVARAIDPQPDPYVTWELRRHLAQSPLPILADPAHSEDLREGPRIAYNAAVDRGDRAEAARLRRVLEAQIDGRFAADFTGGLHLLGRRVVTGAGPRLELWVEAREKLSEDVRFVVTSVITGRAPLSLLSVDPTAEPVGIVPRIPSSLWVPGFIYELDVAIQHRPGHEHWTGAWTGGAVGHRLDNEPVTELGDYP